MHTDYIQHEINELQPLSNFEAVSDRNLKCSGELMDQLLYLSAIIMKFYSFWEGWQGMQLYNFK
ncbi:MAG: hypothetical protein ACEY3F_00200 [Wolbachia sp.]